MDADLNKFRDDFIDEVNGLLDQLEKDLLDLENSPSDRELIESAFRVMHTIKGASNMFGFQVIGDFSHKMESLYQKVKEGKLIFNKTIFDITFESVDHLRKLLNNKEYYDGWDDKHKNLLSSINSMANDESQQHGEIPNAVPEKSSEACCNWHILLCTSEAIMLQGVKLVNIFRELSTLGKCEISKIDCMSTSDSDTWSIFLQTMATEKDIREVFLFVEEDCTIVNLNQSGPPRLKIADGHPDGSDLSIEEFIESSLKTQKQASTPDPEIQSGKSATRTKKRISVDASKLDQLMFLVSELITVNSQINLTAKENKFNILGPHLEKLDNLSKQFRNNALEIRLVPLGDTVLRFQRLIRDLSKQLNKQINFVTHGTNTELDKNTIDQLTEPLMHLIRNCIDHGIEYPDVRLSKGKSSQGTITLSAYNSGNYVYITLSDDGCGIDVEKVRNKAVDLGHLKPGDKPGKKELFDFIFMPGFSTAQNLTEVSGRGVGMDVVKNKIADLRGEVFIDSEEGKGTTFTLKLQQSMSIIDSLLFEVGETYFTVPISEIAICTQTESSELSRQKHTSTLAHNDHLIPFVDLRYLFNISGDYCKNLKTIIIQNTEREIALICDRIIGEHQAVLKPLGRTLRKQEYITAASQMGDGQIAFMIDTSALFKTHKI
ncbi:MAG TPA: chemotaxis protein CheA [Bacteroidales bacterium]|nr:chemotaxis protein CheA [Bacteroidales bacterium]